MKMLILGGLFCAATALAQTEIISDDIHLSGDDVDFGVTLLDNSSHSFKAVKTITTEGNVTLSKDTKVDFTAGKRIVLKNGFKAKKGSTFHAKIEKVEMTPTIAEKETTAEFPRKGFKTEENIPVSGFKNAMLLGSYPNPSAGISTVEYQLNAEQSVTISIMDAHGRTVAQLLKSESHGAGRFTAQFNGADLPSGEYFIMLRTPTHSEALKLVIVK
jgi:hypothetical protein